MRVQASEKARKSACVFVETLCIFAFTRICINSASKRERKRENVCTCVCVRVCVCVCVVALVCVCFGIYEKE